MTILNPVWCPVYWELFCYSWYCVNPGDWHLLLSPPPGFFFTSSWCLCWSRWSELIWPFEGALPVHSIPSAYSYQAFGYLDHTEFSLRSPHISLGCVEFSLGWTVNRAHLLLPLIQVHWFVLPLFNTWKLFLYTCPVFVFLLFKVEHFVPYHTIMV